MAAITLSRWSSACWSLDEMLVEPVGVPKAAGWLLSRRRKPWGRRGMSLGLMPVRWMTSGGIGPRRYAPVEQPRRGAFVKGYSVRAAPPMDEDFSRTVTDRPDLASMAAATSPLCPAPTTTTSVGGRFDPGFPKTDPLSESPSKGGALFASVDPFVILFVYMEEGERTADAG